MYQKLYDSYRVVYKSVSLTPNKVTLLTDYNLDRTYIRITSFAPANDSTVLWPGRPEDGSPTVFELDHGNPTVTKPGMSFEFTYSMHGDFVSESWYAVSIAFVHIVNVCEYIGVGSVVNVNRLKKYKRAKRFSLQIGETLKG